MRKLRPTEAIKLKEVKDLIKFEMKDRGLFYKKTTFACYDSNIFTYTYKTKEGLLIETSFIADDTLLSKMSFKEIIELKEIKFLWQRLFLTSFKPTEIIGQVMFSLEDSEI